MENYTTEDYKKEIRLLESGSLNFPSRAFVQYFDTHLNVEGVGNDSSEYRAWTEALLNIVDGETFVHKHNLFVWIEFYNDIFDQSNVDELIEFYNDIFDQSNVDELIEEYYLDNVDVGTYILMIQSDSQQPADHDDEIRKAIGKLDSSVTSTYEIIHDKEQEELIDLSEDDELEEIYTKLENLTAAISSWQEAKGYI